MKIIFNFILTAIITCMLSFAASAQSDNFAFAAFQFQLGFPTGEFKTTLGNKTGIGLGGDLQFRLIKEGPIYAGIHLNYISFESFEQEYQFKLGSFNKQIKVSAGTNLFAGYGTFRYIAPVKYVKPYIEGMIGVKNLYLRKTLEEYNNQNSAWEKTDSDTKGDFALGYGVTGGLFFHVGKNMAIDLKCAYILGGTATSFKKKEVIDETQFEKDPFSAFESFKSKTDMIIPQIGVIFWMNPDSFKDK